MFPPLQLGFQTSKAACAELKGQVVTFLREKKKRGGGWGREGLAPEGGREGGKCRRRSGLFSFLLCCP